MKSIFMNAHANQAQLKHIEIYARRKKKKKNVWKLISSRQIYDIKQS